jgi:hypothetical protein
MAVLWLIMSAQVKQDVDIVVVIVKVVMEE